MQHDMERHLQISESDPYPGEMQFDVARHPLHPEEEIDKSYYGVREECYFAPKQTCNHRMCSGNASTRVESLMNSARQILLPFELVHVLSLVCAFFLILPPSSFRIRPGFERLASEQVFIELPRCPAMGDHLSRLLLCCIG